MLKPSLVLQVEPPVLLVLLPVLPLVALPPVEQLVLALPVLLPQQLVRLLLA